MVYFSTNHCSSIVLKENCSKQSTDGTVQILTESTDGPGGIAVIVRGEKQFSTMYRYNVCIGIRQWLT